MPLQGIATTLMSFGGEKDTIALHILNIITRIPIAFNISLGYKEMQDIT